MTCSIIIPVANIHENRCLDKLLDVLENQTLKDFEVILVIGDNRQGRAINQGVNAAHGKWIVTMDDDTIVPDNHLLEKLISNMEDEFNIGLGGAACIVPESASIFQKKAMLQIPRRFFPVQSENVESDFVQHPCLIISRELFLQIGGEDEELIRGLDPVLRQKVRDAGKKVCILANTAISHLIPDSYRNLFRMYKRNGWGSAYAQRFFPSRVLELTDGYDKGKFTKYRPLIYRIIRRVKFIVTNVFLFKWLRITTDIAYIIGWLEGYFSHTLPECDTYITYNENELQRRKNYNLRKLEVTKRKNSTDEQMARLHISSDIDFVLGNNNDNSLNFFRDKVAIFREFSNEGIIIEKNDSCEVQGFILMLFDQKEFKKALIKKGYALRYIISIITGRYKGSPEGWKKWIRLPMAFISRRRKKSACKSAKIVAFIVREDMRGKGLGSKLLASAEKLTIEKGIEHLEITVNKNNEAAKRLYERSGFKITGEILESTGASYQMLKSLESF